MVRCHVSLGKSGFSLVDRYPAIKGIELKHLARALLASDSGATSQLFKENIKSYTHGKLPHARHVISALYNLMESEESIEESPLPTAKPSNRLAVDGDWIGLKKALTSSLTSGTFLDTQFYAVESRSPTSPPRIRPIYFCSTVGGSFTSKLLAGSLSLSSYVVGFLSFMSGSSKLVQRKGPLPYEDDYDSDVGDNESDKGCPAECHPSLKWFVEPSPPDSVCSVALSSI